jgi:hypothetical protein
LLSTWQRLFEPQAEEADDLSPIADIQRAVTPTLVNVVVVTLLVVSYDPFIGLCVGTAPKAGYHNPIVIWAVKDESNKGFNIHTIPHPIYSPLES